MDFVCSRLFLTFICFGYSFASGLNLVPSMITCGVVGSSAVGCGVVGCGAVCCGVVGCSVIGCGAVDLGVCILSSFGVMNTLPLKCVRTLFSSASGFMESRMYLTASLVRM